jgi:hypothetical protein
MYLENFKIYIMVILLAQQIKYYLALLLIIVLLVDWFIIFIAVPKLLPKQTGLVWPRKRPNWNSALFIDWLGRTLKTENIDESTTFEIEKTLSACKP